MRNFTREAVGRGLIALLSIGLLACCLSGCASVPRTASSRSSQDVLLARAPPASSAASPTARRVRKPDLSARLGSALRKSGKVLLELILPIPSGEVPSWATQARADCIAHVLSQWCTQFHLQ